MSVVIWNPNAGQKLRGAKPALTEDDLRSLLDRHGIAARVVPTESTEDAQRAVHEAIASGHTTVIAAGGDGTIELVATELLGRQDIALGMLPLGTVMNFARMVRVPRDLDDAAAIIAEGRTRLIDAGEANGTPFYETLSVGMNAAMFSAAAHFEDGDWGSPLRVLTVAFRFQPARMTVELDDQTLSNRALMVTISNGAYMGLAMAVAPGARLDDGVRDAVVVEDTGSIMTRFWHARHLATGSAHRAPVVTVRRIRHAVIETDGEMEYHVDGEPGTAHGRIEVSIIAGALRVRTRSLSV